MDPKRYWKYKVYGEKTLFGVPNCSGCETAGGSDPNSLIDDRIAVPVEKIAQL